MDLKKVEFAYQRALSLQGADRESYLDQLRRDGLELATEVERLVTSTIVDDAILREPIEASAAMLAETETSTRTTTAKTMPMKEQANRTSVLRRVATLIPGA